MFNLEYVDLKVFLMFVQIYLIGINDDERKLPAKLRSFIAKLHAVAKRNG